MTKNILATNRSSSDDSISPLLYIHPVIQLLISLRNIWQYSHSIDIQVFDMTQQTPNSKAQECTSCLHWKAVTNMRKEDVPMAEDMLYHNRCG